MFGRGAVSFHRLCLSPLAPLATRLLPHLGKINVTSTGASRSFSSLLLTQHPLRNASASAYPLNLPSSPAFFDITVRHMNRNARRPKKANHGKRPCSHARRREKLKHFRSTRLKTKIFGFFT